MRLSQGDFSRETVYDVSPAEVALKFLENGFGNLHVVDLDGARNGKPVNLNVLRELSSIGGLEIEWGGGIKTAADVDAALAAGAASVVCGTVAVRNPVLFKSFLEEYGPERITLGADVRGTKVAVSGWMETSEMELPDLIRSFLPKLKNVIVTEISKDGMFSGADPAFFLELMRQFPGVEFTASGGVGSLEDIKILDAVGVPKVIVGKALYERRIKLEDLAQWSRRG